MGYSFAFAPQRVGRLEYAALATNGRKTRVAGGADRATVRSLGEAGGEVEQMIEDVRAGLLAGPKDLSQWPKYFYDEKGSELFEEITALPEYYQTRTELSILREKAPEIVTRTGCRELVELGSGSSSKTRVLLDAMTASSPEGPN